MQLLVFNILFDAGVIRVKDLFVVSRLVFSEHGVKVDQLFDGLAQNEVSLIISLLLTLVLHVSLVEGVAQDVVVDGDVSQFLLAFLLGCSQFFKRRV